MTSVDTSVSFCPWTLHSEDLKELLAFYGSTQYGGMAKNYVCPTSYAFWPQQSAGHECFIA